MKVAAEFGLDVWVIWGPNEDGNFVVAELDSCGDYVSEEEVSRGSFRNKLRSWWFEKDQRE